MAVNKVIYGDRTLIDLSDDTVSASSMLSGVTAHDKSGNIVEGDITFAEAVTVDEITPNPMIVSGTHCDENGIWHYPLEEWSTTYNGEVYDNNIELIPIDFDNDEEVIYLLYDCRYENSFCSIKPRQDYIVEYGLSKNGVFISLGSLEVKDNTVYTKWLTGEPYTTLIIKITPKATKHLTQVSLNAWVSDGTHTALMGSTYNSVLMRYGNMPYGTNISFQGYYLESDNVVNFAKNLNNTALTITSAYNSAYRLQRWRNNGWNIAGNYTATLASMFSNCLLLVDTPEVANFSKWCSNQTISIYNMFGTCYAWRNPIDVSGWDLSALTSAESSFKHMRAIEDIRGINTWIGGALCTKWIGAFDSCYNLKSDIDLSGITIGSACSQLNNMFNNCYKIKNIKLPDLDLSNVTTMASMFTNDYALQNLSHGTIIPPLPGKLTSVNNIFNNCYSLASTDFLESIDLSNANSGSIFSSCNSIIDSRLAPTGTSSSKYTFPYSTVSTPYAQCKSMVYLDLSWLDVDYDSSASKSLQASILYGFNNVIELYPPKNLKNVATTINSCQRLSHDSLMRIINALPQGNSKLTMGSQNLAKLTDEEKAVATQKGWTLA